MWPRGDGAFSVADGNHTFTVLNEAGALAVPVRVEHIRNKGSASLEALYADAKKAEPEFKSLMEELQSQLGGELVFRPEIKTPESIDRKALKGYDGDYSRVVDVLAASLVFDTEEDLLRAAEFLREDNRVVRIKDRWASPGADGYRDYMLNVRLPGKFVVELQLHHGGVLEAKNLVGHELYKLAELLHERGNRTLWEGVLSLSREIYEKALETGQSAPAALSASSLETLQALRLNQESVSQDIGLRDASGRILKALGPFSPPSAGTQFPSGPISMANGMSSSDWTKKSNDLGISTTSDPSVSDNSGKGNGIVSEVVTGEGAAIQTHFRVVDAFNLIASHTEGFSPNKNYPVELQPRQRSRAAAISDDGPCGVPGRFRNAYGLRRGLHGVLERRRRRR